MNIMVLLGLVFAIVMIIFGIITAMCPKCHALFGKEEISRTSIPKRTFLSSKKVRLSYRCKRCGHEWHRDWPENGDSNIP